MGSSPRVLNHDMKSTVSRSLQSLPTSSHAFEPGEENKVPFTLQLKFTHIIVIIINFMLNLPANFFRFRLSASCHFIC